MSNDRKKIFAIFIVFSFVLSTFSVFASNVYQAEIDENISLEESGPHRVLVKVHWNPNLEPIMFEHDAVIAELKAEAARTQAPVLAYLSQKQDAKVLNTFWLTNVILVEAEAETLLELATLTSVKKVFADFKLTVPANEVGEEPSESSEATWNVEKVRAPEVWPLKINGTGIRFATTDSGIEVDHPDLVGTLYTADPADPKYPGGWVEFDANGDPVWSTPHDTDGHGTATYGLIVGDAAGPYGAVGMAPEAVGMHALSLPGGGGDWPQVEAGLQWVIDPYDEAGNKYPPAQVSSHSWGAAYYYGCELVEAIENMRAAGHIVFFASGNEGVDWTRTPANYYSVFSVGATDRYDDVLSWSSGEWVYRTDFPCELPDYWPDKWLEPHVSAPGSDVIVPYWGKTWITWSGTSFSCPHVAGAAVLMLSGNPSLSTDEVYSALERTSVWYDRYYPERPDIRYGWGRLDAYEAVLSVAVPQGVRGYVTDAETGKPISRAKIYAEPADRSVYTDEDGFYDIRLLPDTYNVTFSRFGYYEETVYDVEVVADVFTWLDKALTPTPPGYVEGHVYFQPTTIGLPGAKVEVLDVPITIEDETDAEGYYHLAIPPGTYDLEASAYGFTSDLEEGVGVAVGETTTVDFYLEQPPKIAVVDYYTGITKFLKDEGYIADSYRYMRDVAPKASEYSAIVVGYIGSTAYSEFADFITETDKHSVGVVWLDQWYSYCGAYILRYWTGWPPYRYTSYSTYREHTYYRVIQSDGSIIPPEWGAGHKIIHDESSYYKMMAYYRGIVDGYREGIGEVKRLASTGYRYYGNDYEMYDGIVKVTRDTNKWVLLSLHAETPYISVGNWHADTKTVFLNSLNHVAKPQVGIPKFVPFDLDVEPEVTMWKYPITVSVGIKNVGWITGTDTVEMYIDTILEGSEDVTLAPGEYTYLSWPNIHRFDVGTYTVRVKHLTAKFKVRPPTIELKAYEFCTDQPLAGADIYGYYRKYAGPGWFEQWSHTYGGNGHSQHAQPIGDIDEDGVNEVIVGGYETTGTARILSFDAALGTYIEEYNWYVPGGSYHSPSGSTVLDLDEDGDNEFVVSWTYSGADGIYAYDWDGSTLDTLDIYQGEGVDFAFDVYACDYDDDGDIEVLIANAPNMGVGAYNAHVTALGWDNTEGKFTEEAWWHLSGYEGYMECPMVWSGDVDGDEKTEVVACISDSYYSTAGTWALHWDGTKWTEELVYDKLINTGTHYGVAVGDVDGDGIPEIGIGNDYSDYSIMAGAVLIGWDGSTYQKVWEGKWSTESPVIEAVAIGDADNDGQNEFLAGGGDVHIISWTGTEYAEEATITETEGMLSGVVIGDCDTDGLNEVKATNIIYGPGKEHIFKYTEKPTPIPGWYFKHFGRTDENGVLAFDSPASVVDIHLFVYKPEMSEKGYQYLLQKDMHIDNDIAITYEPHSETEAVVISELEESSLADFPHLGITWLWKLEVPYMWPFPSWYKDQTNIVVSPAVYAFMHELYEVDAWGTWRYMMMNSADRWGYLPPDTTYQYDFVGPIEGYVKHTDNTDGTVTVEWDVTDSHGHHISGVSLDEVGSLSMAYEPVDIDEYKAMSATIIQYKPLITLYDENNNILKSGYVEWSEKTVTADVSGLAYATLRFKAGPYGDPAPEEIVWWTKEP